MPSCSRHAARRRSELRTLRAGEIGACLAEHEITACPQLAFVDHRRLLSARSWYRFRAKPSMTGISSPNRRPSATIPLWHLLLLEPL